MSVNISTYNNFSYIPGDPHIIPQPYLYPCYPYNLYYPYYQYTPPYGVTYQIIDSRLHEKIDRLEKKLAELADTLERVKSNKK